MVSFRRHANHPPGPFPLQKMERKRMRLVRHQLSSTLAMARWTWFTGRAPRADTGEERIARACVRYWAHGGRGGARLPWDLLHTSSRSNSRTHTFASATRDGRRFSDLTLRTPPRHRALPSDIASSTTTGCASPPPACTKFLTTPIPVPNLEIDRSNNGHGHDVHGLRAAAPCSSCLLRGGRSTRRRVLVGRPGRREPRPRPRHLRLHDSGHGPRRDHRRAHRAGHGDGRAARHGRRGHHGRAGVHGGRRVVPRAVALQRAGHLERRLRARCDLELAERPPRTREGGPCRAQRRREPDERSGDTGLGWRPRRHLRYGRHHRHGEGRHRRAPHGDVHRAQQPRRQRRAHRLLGLPPGVPSRRQREEPAGVSPHVPPAVHRRLAAPACFLPSVPARSVGRPFLSA